MCLDYLYRYTTEFSIKKEEVAEVWGFFVRHPVGKSEK